MLKIYLDVYILLYTWLLILTSLISEENVYYIIYITTCIKMLLIDNKAYISNKTKLHVFFYFVFNDKKNVI